MQTILWAIINNPKDGVTLILILGLFGWCTYKFGIIAEQIKTIIETQIKDNNSVIEKLDDLKSDIKDLSDKLFEYVRSQQK
jgi:hypothetical protein